MRRGEAGQKPGMGREREREEQREERRTTKSLEAEL